MTNNRYEGFKTAQDRERRAVENRQKVADHLAEERRKDYEARQHRDTVDTVNTAYRVREYRRGQGAPAAPAPFASPTGNDGDPGAPDLDAAAYTSHGSALASPTGTVDSEQERYEKELAAFEEKARQARCEGWAHSLTPPTPPKKNRQPITPY